jgi:hypothetical protein
MSLVSNVELLIITTWKQVHDYVIYSLLNH